MANSPTFEDKWEILEELSNKGGQGDTFLVKLRQDNGTVAVLKKLRNNKLCRRDGEFIRRSVTCVLSQAPVAASQRSSTIMWGSSRTHPSGSTLSWSESKERRLRTM